MKVIKGKTKIINVSGKNIAVKDYINPFRTDFYKVQIHKDFFTVYNHLEQGCAYSFDNKTSLQQGIKTFCSWIKTKSFARRMLKISA